MSDLKAFAERATRAAHRAEHLRLAINWMEPEIGNDILTEPSVTVEQVTGGGVNGHWQAMELISIELKSIVEVVAKSALEKAKKELADIEDMFSRFTEQENAR